MTENRNNQNKAGENTAIESTGKKRSYRAQGSRQKENAVSAVAAGKETAEKKSSGKGGTVKKAAEPKQAKEAAKAAGKETARKTQSRKADGTGSSQGRRTAGKSTRGSGAKTSGAKTSGKKAMDALKSVASNTKQQAANVVKSAALKPAAEKTKGARGGLLGKRRSMKKKNGAEIRIIPLGGLEQIGMNITAFEYGESIVVVDCGMAFPEDDMLGIDLVIPDISYLKQNSHKVKGFFITHGHEDHIGALPYILRDLNVPVYSTKLTIALISNKLREAQLLDSAKLVTVKHGDMVDAGDFTIEFIKTNHSIQDASALAIHSPAGVILHTGDFKVDYTPVFGDAIDLQRFAEIGKAGCLALLADSTNALRPGFTMSERTVGRTFDAIFAEHAKERIIIATFASNVDRVQQVINDAEKYGRKVVVEGRSMVNVIGTAVELGYITINSGTLIDISQIKDYPDDKVVLVTTGSQGESMAALSRMASGIHKKVTIKPNDVIVLSSTPIPGNEKAVSKVINELSQKGAQVICQDTHVSGHACQEELKLIYSLVHPKFAIPLHGEYRHRLAQKQIAQAIGLDKDNVLIAETGDVIALSEESCSVVDKVQAGPLLVDGLGIGDVGNIVLRDRQSLSQNGIIIIVLALEKHTGRLLSGPDIVSRGFVYVRENEDLMEEARQVVADALDDCLSRRVSDWGKIKNVIRDALSDYLWRKMKRTPVILPIISEVS